MNKKELGRRIAAARKAAGLTQDDVAGQLSLIRQTYGAYERGVSVPDALTLDALATLFSVSTDALLGRSYAGPYAPGFNASAFSVPVPQTLAAHETTGTPPVSDEEMADIITKAYQLLQKHRDGG